MKRYLLLFVLAFGSKMEILAQQTFPYNGVLAKDVTSIAFTNATIFVDANTRLENAILVVEKGKVVDAGVGINIPSNAVVYDMKGLFIYPSFIDAFSDFGMPVAAPAEIPVPNSDPKGAFGWNPAIKADFNAAANFSYKDDAAKELRGIGFGTVVSQRMDGIARGTSAAIALQSAPQQALIKPAVAANFSFNKGTSPMQYPSSIMGSIALLRQTYYDAQWYEKGGDKQERNLSLAAMVANNRLPAVFDAGDKWNIFRADKVGDEFAIQYILKTNGTEYQRIEDVKTTGATLIVPLTFPDAYDVSDPYNSQLVSLDEMKHWELAPSNCAMLWNAKIPYVITSHGLLDRTAFLKNLRKAIQRGLPENEALRALTSGPATLFKMENEIGSLKKGTWANFFIASGNIFTEGTIIHENWVQGEQFVIDALGKPDVKGMYDLKVDNQSYKLEIKEDGGKLKSSVTCYQIGKRKDGSEGPDTLTYQGNLALQGELITFTFDAADRAMQGVIRLAGETDETGTNWKGQGQKSDGTWINWSATRTSKSAPIAETKKESVAEKFGEIIYPFVANGWMVKPTAENVLITNATIWTCEKEGKIENGQILISNGKIVQVGKSVNATAIKDVKTIDAKGKHVTPGIIDEHSHIALASVNEGAQASSAEVEQGRVIMPEDISIYRQLSGGVTCSQLLHGSSNPIGGQSALIKLHWGGNAEDMLVDNAPGFIKFALGENVKQANWHNDGSRFPQTRMGVEQMYYDHFIRAREYGEAWKKYNVPTPPSSKKKKDETPRLATTPIRRDLEMDALYEILIGKRFVTCHSYVQSEINMLMHVADSMQFRLNTFTHILEGYKVADKMKAHGAGASSFSDWWAYKYEVKDAIPHNGALMWEQGIVVAFNSDDDEMARRLNQEAAKAVKYGNVPEEEALKFVTLNPAKLLHIDNRTGSLLAGKDADLVIWSDSPLSIYAKAEKTFVDGICYYDIESDLKMREWIEQERARLIQKMLQAKKSGEPVQQPTFKDPKKFHCDTMDETGSGVWFKK
ncbi:MAG: amidohydrolase family protein [Flavobacteriales bacterium]